VAHHCYPHSRLPFPTRRSSDLRPASRTAPSRGSSSSLRSRHRTSPAGWWRLSSTVGLPSRQSTPPSSPPSWSQRCREATTPSSRSEEHTSELQSRENIVCRLLL